LFNFRSEGQEFLEAVKECWDVVESGCSSYGLVDLLNETNGKVYNVMAFGTRVRIGEVSHQKLKTMKTKKARLPRD